MHVLGAGLARTGTTSIAAALTHLLGAPCYHMEALFTAPGHLEAWARAAESDTLPDWSALFDGYAAAVGMPVCLHLEPLLDRYPEAPVLLSTRRSPQAWLASWHHLFRRIEALLRLSDRLPRVALAERVIHHFVLQPAFDGRTDDTALLSGYHRHIERIHDLVPTKRLTVFQVEEGWAPLCQLVGRPVPSEPFPGLNRRGDRRTSRLFRQAFLPPR